MRRIAARRTASGVVSGWRAGAGWNALRDFTHSLVEEKGWLNEEKVRSFFNAGFTRTQVFEVIMGVALKTMTNYSNHLACADPNAEFTSMAEGQTAA